MTTDIRDMPRREPLERLTGSAFELSQARAAASCRRFDEAGRLLARLVQSADWRIATRAKIQLALTEHGRGNTGRAVEAMEDLAEKVRERRTVYREWLQSGEVSCGSDPKRDSELQAYREVQMEMARTWNAIGRAAEAERAYRELLHETSLWGVKADAQAGDLGHLVALAEFRLAELLVDDHPEEAYQRFKRALDARDERVSPYAALRLATAIGSRQLVQGRIEWLFRIAMGSGDPELYCEAALGMARHLKERRLFAAARRYLQAIQDVGIDSYLQAAAAESKSLDRAERTADVRLRLTRNHQLRARLHNHVASRRTEGKRVLVVGAGTGGIYLLESLAGQEYTICGFVDDQATEVPGYPQYRVLGGIDGLARIIDDYRPSQVLLAIPTLSGSRRRAVVAACREKGVPLLSLPRIHELGIGWKLDDSRGRLMAQLKSVHVAETIGDEPVLIDALATRWLQYEPALVIGGGALGAEICRRLADGEVGQLTVIDLREAALTKIENDLVGTRGFWGIDLLEGKASDCAYLTDLFEARRPSVVFNTIGHASARAFEREQLSQDPHGWRRVLLGEILAATAVAQAAANAKVPRTIHVSSRRAGMPGDPFGAAKALVEEMIFLHGGSDPASTQAVVRVGALLDSRNGRLSRLKGQIRTGMQVTIPAGEATVRFVSTARWAELVLHAAQRDCHGELLEPDTGEEVSIEQIAEEAIRLEGWYPGEPIAIKVDGNRWDYPPSAGARHLKTDERLGIYSLERLQAGEASLERAISACAELVCSDEHTAAEARSAIRDVLGEVERAIERTPEGAKSPSAG